MRQWPKWRRSYPGTLDLAYNTVLTTLRILEAKGYLKHDKAKEARAFVYRPVVGRAEAVRTSVRQLLRRFFEGSPEALVLNLLEDGEFSEDELKKIRQRLESEGERK